MKKSILFLLAITFMVSCKDKAAKTDVATTDKVENAGDKVVEAAQSFIGAPYNMDVANSRVVWTGTKPTGKHTGNIGITKGTVYVQNGKVTGGIATVDMNSIDCTDLSGDYKADLEAHLKGSNAEGADDFFNTTKFPSASIVITKVIDMKNSKTSHMAMGNLTIKGITKAVGIPCDITVSEDGVSLNSKGFQIDRTQFGINYKSKSIFTELKEKFINDKVGIDLVVTAVK